MLGIRPFADARPSVPPMLASAASLLFKNRPIWHLLPSLNADPTVLLHTTHPQLSYAEPRGAARGEDSPAEDIAGAQSRGDRLRSTFEQWLLSAHSSRRNRCML